MNLIFKLHTKAKSDKTTYIQSKVLREGKTWCCLPYAVRNFINSGLEAGVI